jgi:hypothetical protein
LWRDKDGDSWEIPILVPAKTDTQTNGIEKRQRPEKPEKPDEQITTKKPEKIRGCLLKRRLHPANR